MLHVLPDGTAVRTRRIAPADKQLLLSGLAELSPDSVRQRFLAPKATLSDAELRYLTEVDGRDHVAIIAVLAHDPTRFVGVARFVRDPLASDQAEAAIVVGDRWQGLGLGRALGLELADAARARGIRRFTAMLFGTNVAAHRLFVAISRRLRSNVSQGIEELVAELYTEEHRLPPPLAA